MAAGFVPIVTEGNPVTTVPHAAAPVIEVRLAGPVERVASGTHDAAQLTAVSRAIRGSRHRRAKSDAKQLVDIIGVIWESYP
jgi:hypothetical protein